MSEHHRLIILGAGTAGLVAYKEAARHSKDILLIDPGPLGTTCARVGCMPSKVLLQVAKEFHSGRRLTERKLTRDASPAPDGPAVMQHVRTLRDGFASGAIKMVEKLGDRYLKGRPRFVSPDTLEIDGRQISADAIIVATGTRPVVPEPWQALGERLITSDTIFDLETLPQRMAVVGLGAIGAELGQALAWLGVEVQAFGRSERLAGLDDDPVNEAALEAIGQSMTLHTGHDVEVEAADNGVTVNFGEQRFEFDALLAAVGRRPNIEDLNLAALGLPLQDNGLPEIDPQRLRAGDTPVYFAGDLNGIRPLMHEAADEGRIVAHHALHPDADCLQRRTALGIVFTEPQIAQVGMPFSELPDDALIGKADFSDQGRAVILDQNHGLLRVYSDTEGRLLGAQMAIPGAEHIAHELAWLIQQNLDVDTALQLPYYHPVLEEGLRSALQGIRRQLEASRQRPDLPLCGDEDDPLAGARLTAGPGDE
ncbi:dihydrolipoyl dehydrogenase [Thiohalophilus thiocyanatoxydans]|uniref:Dihydrolipoamide dehydrogenase n=1 Tax=Thiohalophilus thiocyanatoxydans TaxID=381308 RepID=A0A4V3H3D2_9GAMM|nr:dihydrolipoyl dehydrogenase [Thiohalophilus thiocyanatoxydans]TDX97913.1 dihydrolipoamide dehydrogenase [Thiohalophilus thiocyanatoxydans]